MTNEKQISGRQLSGKKSSEGGKSNPKKASPAAIERYLKDIKYPVGKKDLINSAKGQNAPSDVISVLERFSEHQYKSPVDITKEVGKVEFK
jgi:hypothetical protein